MLCRKSFLSLVPLTAFDETSKVYSVPFFIQDFNLLSCELDNLQLKCYIESFYIDIILSKTKLQCVNNSLWKINCFFLLFNNEKQFFICTA